jgi:hypothetical protein
MIKKGLIENNCGSRVITTTCISDVALEVGDVHNMEPLSEHNSKKLLYIKIGNGPPNNESAEAVEKILKKCGGVPLSIITIASLLVGKPVEDWSKVYDSIGFGSGGNNDVVEDTRKILSFSYHDLPWYLKTCLLYLSIYPEDHEIDKEELIWKWVAEEFVKKEGGIELYDVGERYFTELVNKSMIQPIEDEELGIMNGCSVHDMVLDLIRILATEGNFITILDRECDDEEHCSPSSSPSSCRWLAMHNQFHERNNGSVLALSMSQVRSFNVMQCLNMGMIMPSILTKFHILHVLSLENCGWLVDDQLKHLGKLLQLRYLGLRGTHIAHLPSEIMEDLEHLQTLDVRDTFLDVIPATVSQLRKLIRLCFNGETRMLPGVGKLMTSLQELRMEDANNWPDFDTEVGKLTELRKLKFGFYGDEGANDFVQSLGESMCFLHNLQDLEMNIYSYISRDSWDGWDPSWQHLRKLNFGETWLNLPAWVNHTCLSRLTHLRLEISMDEARELDVLAMMPELCFLSIQFCGLRRWTVPCGGSFPKLRHIVLHGGIAPTFLLGVMPMLTKLQLYKVKASAMTNGVGLGNLSQLNHVDITINCDDCSHREVEKARSVLTREIKEHPNTPTSTVITTVQFIPVAPSVSSTCSFFLTFRYFHSNVKSIFQNEHRMRDDEEETSNGTEEVSAVLTLSLSLSLSARASNYLVTVTSLSPSFLLNSPFCLTKLLSLVQCQFQSEENEETH